MSGTVMLDIMLGIAMRKISLFIAGKITKKRANVSTYSEICAVRRAFGAVCAAEQSAGTIAGRLKTEYFVF
jgi:hypothetical protein